MWQRAIGDPGKKRIFCLVHAEKLSYQVCDEVVGTLKELSQGKLGNKKNSIFEKYNIIIPHTFPDYRLVILCSKEGEDKSHIVSKLLLHKKSIVLKHSQVAYQSYLKNHFICGADDSPSQTTPDTASIVDCDKLAVHNTIYYCSGHVVKLANFLLAARVSEWCPLNDLAWVNHCISAEWQNSSRWSLKLNSKIAK